MKNVIYLLTSPLFVATQLFSAPIFASQITFKGTVEVQDASYEFLGREVTQDGWTYQEGTTQHEAYYEVDFTIEEDDLPIDVKMGPSAVFSIDKGGLIYIGTSTGDGDAAAESQLQLPVNDQGQLVAIPLLTLKTKGGDYTSNQWAINANLSFAVKE